MEFTTPSGYRVTLKKDITFGQFLELQKIMTANLKIDTDTKKVSGIDGAATATYMSKMMEYMVEKILTPKNESVENIMGCITDMPRSDGLMIQEKIQEVNDNLNPAKKK